MMSAGCIPLPFAHKIRSLPGLALVLVLLSGCAATPPTLSGPAEEGGGGAKVGKVVVRTTFREIPIPGARVEWRRTVDGGKEPPAAVAATDRDGIASFAFPTGRYFLIVHWRKDKDYARPVATGDRHAYFGGNPVYVGRGSIREVFINLEEVVDAPSKVMGPPGGTGVSGILGSNGLPVAGGRVYAYLNADKEFRDLGFAMSAPTGEDGAFVLDLPPGRYFIVARNRTGGAVAGPMRKGDQFGFFAANPVTVDPGRYTPVVIPVTRLKGRNQPACSGGSPDSASIEGRILDRTGRPRKGVYAALYDNPDLLGRPVFISETTGEDGRYRMPVPVPGTYFLGARSGYGGAPAPGDLYGRYEGNPEHAVIVKEEGSLAGIDIVVNEVW